MALQDELRAEAGEVTDTESKLVQAADLIDVREAEIVALTAQVGGVPALEARIAELEAFAVQVRDLAIGVVGAV